MLNKTKKNQPYGWFFLIGAGNRNRPSASHTTRLSTQILRISVPDFTLLAKNLPQANFIYAKTFSGSIPVINKTKKNQPYGWFFLIGAGNRNRTCMKLPSLEPEFYK